jgi:branched-chain amino acid transport system substrate-binding protein
MLKENFEGLGGKVIEGVGYKPPTGDFAASLHRINYIFWEQDLRALDFKVNEAVKQYGANRVGVYVISFDEIVPIMIQAERHPRLSIVKWYGSDGSALNANLVRNVDAADFSIKTSFINPIYAVDDDNNSSFVKVEHEITEEIGHPHRSYAEVAYDALWVAALTSDRIGNNQTDKEDTLKKALVETADSYDGITGKTLLNDAGDRIAGSYGLWAITREDDHQDSSSQYEWKHVITFHKIQ